MSSSTIRTLALALCAASTAPTQQQPWRQLSDPAAAGWDGAALGEAHKLAEASGSAAVMAIHRGTVIVAWGDVERRFKCHSVRKSIMSAMFGIAIERGLIDPEEDLRSLGIDDSAPLSDIEKSARVHHLLAARSGIYHPAAKEPANMKRRRPARHSRKPGEEFHYNNWDFNVLGVIFNKRTGIDVFAAFDDWLAGPLGMADYRRSDGTYELEPSNSRHPAYAFRLSARDLARFGLLYARAGAWRESTIVPREWVEASTTPISKFENGRGYGNMWWTYPAGTLRRQPHLNAHDMFAAIGTGGQLVIVAPSADFVFVHRSDTDNDRHVESNSIWNMADRILGARPATVSAEPVLQDLAATPLSGQRPAPPVRTAIEVDAKTLRQLAGTYRVPPLGDCKVFVFEDRLFVRTPLGQESELFCSAKDRYFMRVRDMTMSIVRGDDRAVTGVELVMRGRPLRGRRID